MERSECNGMTLDFTRGHLRVISLSSSSKLWMNFTGNSIASLNIKSDRRPSFSLCFKDISWTSNSRSNVSLLHLTKVLGSFLHSYRCWDEKNLHVRIVLDDGEKFLLGKEDKQIRFGIDRLIITEGFQGLSDAKDFPEFFPVGVITSMSERCSCSVSCPRLWLNWSKWRFTRELDRVLDVLLSVVSPLTVSTMSCLFYSCRGIFSSTNGRWKWLRQSLRWYEDSVHTFTEKMNIKCLLSWTSCERESDHQGRIRAK